MDKEIIINKYDSYGEFIDKKIIRFPIIDDFVTNITNKYRLIPELYEFGNYYKVTDDSELSSIIDLYIKPDLIYIKRKISILKVFKP